jgi:hypothetical protein
MKLVDPVLLNEFKKGYYRPAVLVNIDNVLFFTDWDNIIYYNAVPYYSRGMRTSSVRSGGSNIVDSFTLTIDDVNREIYAQMITRPVFGVSFEMILLVLDRYQSTLSSTVLFRGLVDGWEYSPGSMRINIVSLLIQWTRRTTKYFSASCRWQKFKGLECKYSGSGSFCDRSYDQCTVYGNTANFGGFRWLPSLSDKRLRTGSTTDDAPQK